MQISRYKLNLSFIIIAMILVLINSSCILFAAENEEEINREITLNKISLAIQWLTEQQRPDGSWPIVTQDKHSCVVATGLFGLGTSLPTSDIKKALSFLLAHQNNEGYWEATSSFFWNKTEATTAALYGLICTDYEAKAVEKGINWLIKNQNTNGSWNDDCWDTSWALYLLFCCDYQTPDSIIIKSASQWLVNDQRDDGSWKANLPKLKQFESLWTTPPVIFALAQTGQH